MSTLVSPRRLNEQVKRNLDRFPEDFMFQLNAEEKTEVVANCDHLAQLKYSPSLPYAFTEHGALMPGNVLKSSRAVEVSLLVVRAFVQIREMLSSHKDIAAKLDQMERKLSSHDQAIAGLIDAIRQLMAPPATARRGIGFTANIDSKPRNKK
ncbi:MAG: ORF6N domain-containing protein [Rhodocyclales bacterium]|nr:ORF6N domain-containing protein [Rhodocyclales bacterium]